MAHQRGKPHGGRPKPPAEPRSLKVPKNPKPPAGRGGRFVSRRDERGVPYPGDWPNPLGGRIRGCF
ncbi:MAG TPA: hypothetical protein VNA89_11115 [Gemmatimonadaceae bacterium]|nr:hypothetical protein [Gemmatimonadaceae bacterium]